MKYFVQWMSSYKQLFKHDKGEEIAYTREEADKIKDRYLQELQKAIGLGKYCSARIWIFKQAWFFVREQLILEIHLDESDGIKEIDPNVH